ncbi:RagB/SusD family nutrient uptake outer membrane protein [Rhizosphaericola mali]|uniref:RagB/SusD family nutrient uptake outer membrane protein n=1 Tax=Rhizosphaericola mali TaxID=2545455 RepID=A0A5P2G0F3_9BACT|nr:RagB/SusD family nutrient uptake outer membrane protein [Rhizosphaericola mali]QES87312.1 RagB/SusD family nutrient uptake outer membrane protein [Rhizosphaericola mali]
MSKNKLSKYILSLLVLSTIIVSCSKEKLNPVISTSLSDAVVFSTSERIGSQLDGLYTSIKSGYVLGGRYEIYNEVRGRNFINRTQNSVTAYQVWNFDVPGSDSYLQYLWSYSYLAINRVNLFIEGMTSTGNSVVGDSLAKQYDGEAKFVRAVAYYNLLQLFCRPYADGNGSKLGLPLRLTGITGSGSSDIARSTVAETYAQILSDLNTAESELPLTYSTDANNTTRAHRNTAIAFKVRVYLSMQDYSNVITEANKIVSSSSPFSASTGVGFALQNSIASVYNSATTKENILSMPFQGTNETPGGQNQLGYYFNYGNLEFYLNKDGILADDFFTASDSRRQFISTQTIGSITYPKLTKYTELTNYTDWVPYMRYSETLLSLSEAITRNSNTIDSRAVALLNAVHNRSNSNVTLTTSNFSSVTDLLSTILKEREIEFLGEGLYGTDISRLMMTYPAKGSVTAVPYSDSRYIFPAPNNETLYNTLWTND